MTVVLQIILKKADDIIQGEKILPAPSADESKIYLCCSSMVTENKTLLSEDLHLQRYTAHKLCSHSIPEAHYNGTTAHTPTQPKMFDRSLNTIIPISERFNVTSLSHLIFYSCRYINHPYHTCHVEISSEIFLCASFTSG